MATGADLPHDPPPRQDPRPRDAIFSEENKNLNYSIKAEKIPLDFYSKFCISPY
jgi:hypothetical protein